MTEDRDTATQLDDTNRRIIDFVRSYHRRAGHAPSLQEIGDHLGMTKQGARWRINHLVAAGLLDRQPGQPRTLSVVRST